MDYTPPGDVHSPRHNWTLLAILDEGNGTDNRGALAVGRWDNKEDPVSNVLAMRWNGTKDVPVGNPQSRGLPTWFIVPQKYNEAILSTLPPDKLTLARVFIPEPK